MTRHLSLAAAALLACGVLSSPWMAPHAQAANQGPIKPGIPVHGTLQAGASDTWNLHANQGQFLRVELDALPGSRLDPAIAIAAEQDGSIVASGHSKTGVGHVVVMASCLPHTGTYNVTARALQGHSSGKYTLHVDVIDQAAGDGATTHYCRYTDTYVDHSEDECSRAIVTVHGQGALVDVQKGQSRYIYIEDSGEILWDCKEAGAFDNERAKCESGTNLILIQRAAVGRHIDWTCYVRHFVS